ncbi:uncharacterized protein METZ01_LOCUS363974, partial [marine metagenome]
QEDGTAEIELPFSQHQAPHSWGFLFSECCLNFKIKEKYNIKKKYLIKLMN